MVHLDLMAWLIIAVAFLFVMVLTLFMAIHESNGSRKFAHSLLVSMIETLRGKIEHLDLRFEEYKLEQEDESEEE